MMRFSLISGAFLGAMLAAGAASAATCSVGTHNSDATFTITVAEASACQSGNDTNTIDADSLFFGLTGWALAAKNDDDAKGDYKLTFGDAPVNDQKSGLWKILNPDNYANVFLTLKAGNGFGAFLLDADTVMAGDWSSNKELSHASIYYQGSPMPSPVPLPAAGFLLAGALGALALRRRKRA